MRLSIEGLEQLRVAAREEAAADEIDHLAEALIGRVVVRRPVAVRLQRHHLLGVQPEQEEILRTDLIAQLDIGAIQGADGERTVHRELHVAGAGGLFARGGDLFGEIGGRDIRAVRW